MKYFLYILSIIFISACNQDDESDNRRFFEIDSVQIGEQSIDIESFENNTDCSLVSPIIITFSEEIDIASATNSFQLFSNDQAIPLNQLFINNNKSVRLSHDGLESIQQYQLEISDSLRAANGHYFTKKIIQFSTTEGNVEILSIVSEQQNILDAPLALNVSLDLDIEIQFSKPINTTTVNSTTTRILTNTGVVPLDFSWNDEQTVVIVRSQNPVRDISRYQLILSDEIKGQREEQFVRFEKVFYTKISPTPKFPIIPDQDLLTLVQQQTFKYFWDFAHPNSGMARERNTSGDLVTTGGSGFGLMAILVGIERNFITREEGIARIEKITNFLAQADRFHGAWPHWINGNTGATIAFSSNDDGGDLVETALMAQGLITVRQYLNPAIESENQLINSINTLLDGIEWDWYTRGGQSVLYWHWSPRVEWAMNLPIRGHNETQIVYILAKASATHGISSEVYHQGYARSGGIQNGRSFYEIPLPLGEDRGGPLFFAHYSYLGLDPRNLQDQYANYWEQNRNHTRINRAYCIANPRNYVGYGPQSWGLTASDTDNGYTAHAPNNDRGVITPTAALSSFPYTPDESLEALKFFYYTLGDRLWGDYGFKDAYNLSTGWVTNSYLAIDQGPIVVMIENHRSGLLWDLFMSAPEVQGALTDLGFTY